MLKIIISQVLEAALNQMLTLDPSQKKFLHSYVGKVLKFDLTDLRQVFYLVIRENRIYLYTTYSGQPDVVVSGTSFAFIKQVGTHNNTNELIIAGDIDLAYDFQLFIKQLDINWQEIISFLVGDFATHQISTCWQQIKANLSYANQRTTEDIKDYLQEEKRFLPSREEVEDFYEEIAKLRLALDRLEARIQQLKDNKK